jgi:hypothetical protein
MIDIFRGKELHGLALDDVRELLDDAESEALHWEASRLPCQPRPPNQPSAPSMVV